MKAKETVAGSVAFAAVISYWIAHTWKAAMSRREHFEERCMEEAMDRFEGEGGLVLS